MKLKTCYRIIEDDFLGYEVQVKRWWFPFWVQMWEYGTCNTWSSVSDAKEWIEKGCPKHRNPKRKQICISEGCGKFN